MRHPETPDGRYFVARDRLWRKTDPRLDEDERRARGRELMRARRAVRTALGDGPPDESGKHPRHSSYAEWWASQEE
ncbi:hypothetical protein [Halomonas nitroreducens]|uniref:Uncharacterized protein n=1 Tax=Halomonas nitroreducens TaxID=447425 RepID=A0A431V243_9GAMM|nr:hypothetical protein [Halomonas nitroreducens]RTR02446.1 hypothetical protein EKG36_12675 [Halomonas nitroreducens]